MKKVAIVIEHPFRSNDIRVDIIEVPENMDLCEIEDMYQKKLLSHFKIIHVSERVNLNAKL